jgi:hypothetical protein
MPQIINLEELVTFETKIALQQFQSALNDWYRFMKKLQDGAAFLHENDNVPHVEAQQLEYMTRLASCISQLILTNALNHSIDLYALFLPLNSVLAQIFKVSALRSTQYLVPLLEHQAQNFLQTHDRGHEFYKQFLMRQLLVYSLNQSAHELSYDVFIQYVPEIFLMKLLALYAEPYVFDTSGESKKEKLLQLAPALTDYFLSNAYEIETACMAWKLCAYFTSQQKFVVRLGVNELITRWLQSIECLPKPIMKTPANSLYKKVIGIWVEDFHIASPLLRAYGDFIEALQRENTVIAFTVDKGIDLEGKKYFSKIVSFAEDISPENISEISQRIQVSHCDALVYLSIGSVPLSIILSNMRLAPVQMAMNTFGGTSASSVIDYVIRENHIDLAYTGLYQEKILMVPMHTFMIKKPAYLDQYPSATHAKKDRVMVAIAAKPQQISAYFLKVLQAVSQLPERVIEYHFFVNEEGLLFDAVKKDLLYQLPTAIVHPKMSHALYLKKLAGCDIFADAFPISDLTHCLDAMRIGVPPVILFSESHACIASPVKVLDAFGCTDGLVANSLEQYAEYLVTLIQSDDKRAAVSNTVKNKMQDEYEALFEERHISDLIAQIEMLASEVM